MRGDPESHRIAGGSGERGRLFLGSCDATRRVRSFIARATQVDLPVLICGESGVGKELVAREIHNRCRRRSGPFAPVNCAAIPETLIEAELFGSEAGAYTDAKESRRGAFELSDRGTLFLDEVGDLSPRAQPKLLRALETGEIVRVGGERARRVDLRVIAATNHDLKKMCSAGRFRNDLFYRLCVLEIRVPPLRERLDDLGELVEHFATRLSSATSRTPTAISDSAVEMLRHYPWPGNVRQLKNVIERAVAFNSGSHLGPASFELDPLSTPSGGLQNLLEQDWRSAREGFANAYAQQQLSRHGGNARRAARAAGLATGSFYKMLRRLGIRAGSSS